MPSEGSLFRGLRAALGTMHGKEAVIAPALRDGLGIDVVVASLDTDAFGTFTREVPRSLSALETARRKARAALASDRAASVGIASEGSFGPHPALPFVACGRELVVILDPARDLEIVGCDVTTETNFAHSAVLTVGAGIELARSAGFPSHGVVVMAMKDGEPDPTFVVKGADDEGELSAALERAFERSGPGASVWIETDMRAHRNPTRMRSIARACADLVDAALRRCPSCEAPGWRATETVPGLPCSDCGAATARARAQIYACKRCNLRELVPLAGPKEASPHTCPLCNP